MNATGPTEDNTRHTSSHLDRALVITGAILVLMLCILGSGCQAVPAGTCPGGACLQLAPGEEIITWSHGSK